MLLSNQRMWMLAQRLRLNPKHVADPRRSDETAGKSKASLMNFGFCSS